MFTCFAGFVFALEQSKANPVCGFPGSEKNFNRYKNVANSYNKNGIDIEWFALY